MTEAVSVEKEGQESQPHSGEPLAPSFVAVDFFCGAGGTTRGLIDAGGYVVAGVDKDDRCRETYVRNNKNESLDCEEPEFLQRDIFPRTADYQAGEQGRLYGELLELIAAKRKMAPGVPLLFAICAPCQPFTTLSRKELSDGRKRGRERDRGLLQQAVKFVRRLKPEVVLSENVAGIRDPRYGGVWDDFKKSLEDLGYATGTKIVCTSKFGVPQFRKRSIMAAVRRDLVVEECFTDTAQGELLIPDCDASALVKSVKEAIEHLPPITAGELHETIPNHRARTLSATNLKRLASAQPGQSNAYMAETKDGDLSLGCHRRLNERMGVRCFTDVYTRMSPDRPSPTITTKCHSISNGRFGHYDTSQLRGISLREAAILQSFPEEYVFYPKDRVETVARMIGNAVPPKLAQFFASYLVKSMDTTPRAQEY
jgi:DNA (cytosine-5)-methyltransferase 1